MTPTRRRRTAGLLFISLPLYFVLGVYAMCSGWLDVDGFLVWAFSLVLLWVIGIPVLAWLILPDYHGPSHLAGAWWWMNRH